jgi:putative membrane protein
MSRLNASLLIGLLALPLALPVDVQAQRPAGHAPKGVEHPAANMNQQDANFLREAALGGRAELQAAQLAQRKASLEQVREFARMLAQDHAASNRVIGELSVARRIDIPRDLDEERQKGLDGLERQTGVAFDGAFLHAQVEAHKKSIQLFEAEVNVGQDADVRSFARDQLSTLKRHLEMAEKLMAPPAVGQRPQAPAPKR